MQAIAEILQNQSSESLHLEFKRSDVLNDSRRDEICKAVSALANSDGGRVVFGIAEDKAAQTISLDGGISNIHQSLERLDSILSDNISPRILNLEISSEDIGGKSFVTVFVPKSGLAPHQSADKRFYKRSNNRSFPMEAYEIDDVRQRRLSGLPPLTVNLEIVSSVFAHLSIRNRSEIVCRDLAMAVKSNFSMSKFQKKMEGSVSLSRLGARQRVDYNLGSIFEILSENKEAAFDVSGTYFSEASGTPIQISDRMSIGELIGSAMLHDEVADRIKDVGKEIRDVKEALGKSSEISKEILAVISGAGLRISPFSISQGSDGSAWRPNLSKFRYEPGSLTLEGLAEVLETDIETIREFYWSLVWAGRSNEIEEILKKLPIDLVERIRARLRIDQE
jgi:hypothetical protein